MSSSQFELNVSNTTNKLVELLLQTTQIQAIFRNEYRYGILTCCPNPTNRKLTSAHKERGNHDSSVRRVSSGVAFMDTHKSRAYSSNIRVND
jgi:hypothetical protein